MQHWLLLIFLASLALLNPWVRGDGVGYYAFARAPLIQHNLDFTNDYISANSSFRGGRLGENGLPKADFRTPTGHLDNHFTVGPAILWSPFLLIAHAGVLLAGAFGASVAADGFSAPYRVAMALGTALYGFLGLWIAFRLAAKYVEERWAFLATIAIWWASSLPIYMYFNPSWSHAHSAFCVALFVWYWHRTREHRSTLQWIVLGAISGLMLNVYYVNAMVLMILVVEALRQYFAAFRRSTPPAAKIPSAPAPAAVAMSAEAQAVRAAEIPAPSAGDATSRDDRAIASAAGATAAVNLATPTADYGNAVGASPKADHATQAARSSVPQLLLQHFLYCVTLLICLLPTFITRRIVYGGSLESGYIPLRNWLWRSPVFLSVLFSSNHGLLAWTPILFFAVAGLILFRWQHRSVGTPLLAAVIAFYILIACYPDWAGISSYGNRFFVSLTPFFIFGLAVFLQRIAIVLAHASHYFRQPQWRVNVFVSVLLAAFIAWNVGLMFQWGTHLVPARGEISWSTMIHNQFSAVPEQISSHLRNYLFRRKAMMQQIENGDVEYLKKNPPPP
ncbi:MAG TPA: glycosyltransferase family 39 protein [Candidatus Acidoferrum sp.]